MPYVSRAGEKLAHALDTFAIDVTGRVCADFGSSTGGFVDCLLQRGAQKVYAVETGYGTIDWKLRNDPRVIVLERSNAMHITLPEPVAFISIDTSWTKLEKIVPNALKNLSVSGGKPTGEIVALLKPHYEAVASMLRKGKLLDEHIPEILEAVQTKLLALGVETIGMVESPIVGGKGGNREFLLHLVPARPESGRLGGPLAKTAKP